MNIIKNLMAASLLAIGTSAHAATVLVPTDGDINFLDVSATNTPWDYELYMLDDSTTISSSLTSNDGLIIPTPSIVGITGPFSNNYIATNLNADTLTLTGSDQFILAIYNMNTGDWIEDSGAISLGANSQRIMFEYNNANDTTAILAVDVEVSPIPLPASVWLMLSGIGALGLMKRQKS